jgi:hypothetical protein
MNNYLLSREIFDNFLKELRDFKVESLYKRLFVGEFFDGDED